MSSIIFVLIFMPGTNFALKVPAFCRYSNRCSNLPPNITATKADHVLGVPLWDPVGLVRKDL